MKITIPEDISDITLEQYQKYHKLTERTDLDEYNLNKRIIELFCGISFHEVDKIDAKDYIEILAMINTAISKDIEFVNRFEINGVEFGFIPNLDEITTAEYFDLSNYGLEVENLHKIMAVLFRPIKSKDKFGNYIIYDYDGTKEYADIMLKTPMNVVNGALVFFWTLAKELQTNIQKYTETVQGKVNKLRAISKSGDDMPLYTKWLKGTY
jgi:hypothetical protein